MIERLDVEALAGKAEPIEGASPAATLAVRLKPAGHILGSAQVVLECQGRRVVVSGDYKRAPDPTCTPFELVPCDLFVTEATFALPVFRHEPADREIGRLCDSLARNADRPHLLGVYALGKCQRMIVLLRAAGYDAPIYLHGALIALCFEGLRERRRAWGDYAGGDAPGLSLHMAPWLHRHGVPAVATDTWGVEVRPNEFDEAFQPLHQIAIPNMGLFMGEMWDLDALAEDCRADGRFEAFLVAAPIAFTGAVGAPVNPIAIK